MGRIFIANIDNEDMLRDRASLTYEFRCHSAVAASKLAWFAEIGDIVVLPEPLSEDMCDYMARVKQIPPDSATFISPDRAPVEVSPLGSDLLNTDLLNRLREAAHSNGEWELCPYHHDRSSAHLARELGIADGCFNTEFFRARGAELFNSKRAFRSLAVGRGVSVAEGEIACSQCELADSLENLIGVTGAVIVKQNCHSGALGNTIVSVNQDIVARGASEVLEINNRFLPSTAARYLWERTTRSGEDALVVEAFHPVSIDCFAEFFIGARHDVPRILNLGEQRMEPLFAGFEIPGHIPPYQQAHFISGATELVRLAQDLGYTGLIDVDGIITSDGEVLFCEVNGRFGGSSHIHYLAERLLGPNYGNTHTLLTRNGVSAPIFSTVLEIIERQGLSLMGGGSEGVLVTAEDTARTGTLDYLVAANNCARAHELEEWFLTQLRGADEETRPRLKANSGYH